MLQPDTQSWFPSWRPEPSDTFVLAFSESQGFLLSKSVAWWWKTRKQYGEVDALNFPSFWEGQVDMFLSSVDHKIGFEQDESGIVRVMKSDGFPFRVDMIDAWISGGSLTQSYRYGMARAGMACRLHSFHQNLATSRSYRESTGILESFELWLWHTSGATGCCNSCTTWPPTWWVHMVKIWVVVVGTSPVIVPNFQKRLI